MRYRERTVEDRKLEASKSRSDSSTQPLANPRSPGPLPSLGPSSPPCCEWCGSSSVPRPFCASCGLPKLHGSELYDKMIAASVTTGWRTMNLERAFWTEVENPSTGAGAIPISPRLARLLIGGDQKRTRVLVLDLRPHQLFTASWIKGSINVHLQTDPGQWWEIPTIPVPRSVVGEGDREKIRQWRSYSFSLL
jgi:hypothetical protein